MISYDEAKRIILQQISERGIIEIYAIPDRISSISVEIIDRYKLSEDIDIINAIKQTKAVMVQGMLEKWINSDKPQLQISAMKMLADDQARANLTGVETPNVDKSVKDNKIEVEIITHRSQIDNLDIEEEETAKNKKNSRK